MQCFMQNKPCLNYLSEKVQKMLKKPQKDNLERNLKHMTIVFNSIHFNTTINTK